MIEDKDPLGSSLHSIRNWRHKHSYNGSPNLEPSLSYETVILSEKTTTF